MQKRPIVVVVVAGLAISRAAFAQTWDGGSATTSNWNDALNWNLNSIPVNNGTAAIVMAGSVRTTPVLNVSYSIASLTFAAGASPFTLNSSGGSILTIGAGGLLHSTTLQTHTLAMPIVCAGPQVWTTNGPLVINGPILANSALSLTPQVSTTSGVITLANTLSGTGTVIKNGVGRLAIASQMINTGGMTINGGEVFLLNSYGLPPTGVVNILSGVLDMNGLEDSVADLTGAAAGSLNLRGRTILTTPTSNRVLASQVIGTNAAQFHKGGSSDLAISNFNGFLGSLWIDGGSVTTQGNEIIANTAEIDVNGQFVVNGAETVGVVNLAGNGSSISGTGSLTTSSMNISGTGTSAISIPISASANGAMTKSGSGRLVLTAPASYFFGGISITDGNLDQQAGGSLNGALSIGPTGTYSVTGVAGIGGLTGSGSVVLQTSGTQLSLSSGLFSGSISGPGKLLKTNNSGGLILSGTINPAQGFEIQSGYVQTNTSNVLGDAIELRLNGSAAYINYGTDSIGTLTLNSGQMTGPGVLTFLNAAVLEQGSITTSLACPAGATLNKNTNGLINLDGNNSGLQSGFVINAGTLEITRDVCLGAPGVGVVLTNGSLKLDNAMSLNRPLRANGVLDCQGDTTILGPVTLTGTLTKIGPGTLTFAGGAPSGGALFIDEGEARFGSGASLQINFFQVGPLGFCTLDGGLLSNTGGVGNDGSLALANGARISTPNINNTGTLEGDGRLQVEHLVNTTSGEIWVNPGDRLWISNRDSYPSDTTNRGAIDVVGGELIVDIPMTNAASTGFIYAEDAILRFRGGLTNAGSMLVSLGTESVFGDINNNLGASIVVSGGQHATFFDDIVNNGQIRTSAGGVSVFAGAISGSGSFPGTGAVYFEGDLRPGNSPANVVFGGSAYFGGGANTHIELGGLIAGTQHDKLTVASQIGLDGHLWVDPINGFVPAGGNSFTIVQAASVIGTFGTVTMPRGMHISYEPTRVRLIYCPADFNDDSVVDFFDYLDFVSAFAANTDAGDFNEDGIVDLFDYLDFVSAFSIGC